MIGPTDARPVTIHVSETVFARLVAKAREAGKTPTLYAKLLFEAAWAARCGKAENDPVLVDCVDKSLRRGPPLEAPARAVPPVASPPVVRWQPMPVIVPIPVPVAVPVAASPEPLAVHVSTSQPIGPEAAGHLATLIGDPPSASAEPEPRKVRLASAALQWSVRSMSAAGNSAREIARMLQCRESFVRDVLAGKVSR